MASDGNFAPGTGRPKIPARAYYPVLGTGLAANINADFMTVIVPLWALTLGATPAQIGIMIGARSFLPFLLAIHGGVLMDRLGTRRMMLVFTLVSTALVPLYPLSPWFPALVALQMMTGLLGNLAWIGAQTLIARMCRGDPHYLGMFSFASRVGSIGAPTLIGLIWDLTGYWGAFAACTLAGLALFACTALVPHWAENQGREPRPQPAAAAGPRWRDLVPSLADYKEVLALLALPAVALGIAIALLRHTPSTIQASFYIIYLREIGLQATVIGALISCAEVTGAFGSLLAAPLMRRFPAHWILVVFTMLTIAMMALTPLLGGIIALLGAAQFLRGSAHGLLHPATFSVISRALDGENQARGVALRTTGNRLGAVVLPIVMGFIAEAVGVAASFVIIGGGLLAIVAVIAVMVARTEAFAGR
ncbi:MAG: MFS transporter [Alphaproteobacteria bacterium]|nr:MAG: MFS transporter [Alphaproteobacteria bacterium]